MTKLKPCPFCGGEVVVYGSSRLRTFIVSHRNRMECSFHHFEIDWTTASSLEEATQVWNNRKDEDDSKIILCRKKQVDDGTGERRGKWIGKWIDNKVAFHRVCSECRAVVRQNISSIYLLECMEKVGKLNYCPNCGTKMEG